MPNPLRQHDLQDVRLAGDGAGAELASALNAGPYHAALVDLSSTV